MRITATHGYGYRPGTWFEVVGVQFYNERPCYLVHIDDEGKEIDHWPIYDASDPYEFAS